MAYLRNAELDHINNVVYRHILYIPAALAIDQIEPHTAFHPYQVAKFIGGIQQTQIGRMFDTMVVGKLIQQLPRIETHYRPFVRTENEEAWSTIRGWLGVVGVTAEELFDTEWEILPGQYWIQPPPDQPFRLFRDPEAPPLPTSLAQTG